MHNYIKKIWIVLFLLIFTQKGFSAAEATPAATAGSGEALKSIFSFIEYAEGTTVAFKEKIESYLQDLRNTHTGARLLARLQEIMGRQVLIIRQIESGGVCFSPVGGILALEINVNQLENSKVGCVGKRAEELVTSTGDTVSVFPIGSCKNPPSAVLGHELIHLLHYLQDMREDKKVYKLKAIILEKPHPALSAAAPSTVASSAAAIAEVKYEDIITVYGSLWPGIDHKQARFRADRVFLDEHIWRTFEEQTTIIGQPGNVEFTENAIRNNLGLPPRYAYQNAELHFYEDANIIRTILLGSLGADWEVVLSVSHDGAAAVYNEYEFNRQEALESRYTPYDFLVPVRVAAVGGGGGAGAGLGSLAPSGASSGSLADVFAARKRTGSMSSLSSRGGGGGGAGMRRSSTASDGGEGGGGAAVGMSVAAAAATATLAAAGAGGGLPPRSGVVRSMSGTALETADGGDGGASLDKATASVRSVSLGRGRGGGSVLGRGIAHIGTHAAARRHSGTDVAAGSGGVDDDVTGAGDHTVARAGRPPRGGGDGATRSVTPSRGLAMSVADPTPAPPLASGDGGVGTTEDEAAGKK